MLPLPMTLEFVDLYYMIICCAILSPIYFFLSAVDQVDIKRPTANFLGGQSTQAKISCSMLNSLIWMLYHNSFLEYSCIKILLVNFSWISMKKSADSGKLVRAKNNSVDLRNSWILLRSIISKFLKFGMYYSAIDRWVTDCRFFCSIFLLDFD